MGVVEDIAWGKPKNRPRLSKELRDFVRHRQGYKCKRCGGSLTRGGQIHHKNGDRTDNRPGNLEYWHTRCHRKKSGEQTMKRAKERKRRSAFGL